ncbi:hypothetical protein [Persicitalea sp.]|uniref:hypothetical protein n=1 Tax=Persicitalea sp. TaxID=3100273 RepID=UPI0035947EF4
MNLKSLIALLLLANYLFLAGMGCISRPEQDSFAVLIMEKSGENQHYESRRYLRTDGLEAFMVESLANRYKDSSDTDTPQIHYLVSGIDAHHLPESSCFSPSLSLIDKPTTSASEPGLVISVTLAIYSPPEAA